MKWLVYLLLISNIGFAAWHFKGLGSREDSESSAIKLNHENQLVLLTEFYQKQRNETLAVGGKLCFSLGPFNRKAHAKKAQDLFKETNFDTKRIQLRDSSRKGFWVTLPATKTRKEAKKHVAQLKKLKIDDYFLVATGSHRNAVSLGVYSQKKLARRRIDEIIRLGFIPRMESVPLPRKVYWLNWYKDDEKQPEHSILSKIKKQHPQISKIERSCK